MAVNPYVETISQENRCTPQILYQLLDYLFSLQFKEYRLQIMFICTFPGFLKVSITMTRYAKFLVNSPLGISLLEEKYYFTPVKLSDLWQFAYIQMK